MTTENKMSRAEISAQESPYAWPPESVLNPGRSFVWKKVVVFDFHQVVTDWLEQYCKYANKQIAGLNLDPKTFNFYNMQFDPSNKLTPHQHEKLFINFARLSRGGYGSLKPYPGIKEAFQAILDAGIKIKIYTWTPGATEKIPGGDRSFGSGMAQRVTRELIASLDLGIDADRDVEFMSAGEKKWKMAEKHIPLIVEDNAETAVSVGMGIGHACILVPEKQNEGLIAPNVLRLNDRSELAPTVISFFEKLDEAGLLL